MFKIKLFGKKKLGQKGSVTLTIVYILTLVIAGIVMSTMSFVVHEIALMELVSDTSYKFMIFFFVWGLPLVILIGSTTWYISRLQKRSMSEY